MSATFQLLGELLHPDIDPAYIAALAWPLAETVGLALAAMTLVFLISLPLAMAAAMGVPGARVLAGGLSCLRAIPDLTLAILCVILLGIGPGAGLAALVIYYTAAVAKVFADLLETAPRPPVAALAMTGASRFQQASFGLLPLAGRDLFDYGAFAFECAVRSAVIVGAVGGGGIGTELVGSLAAFDFGRASTQIILLVVVIAILERLAAALRERPRLLLALALPGLACVFAFAPHFFAFRHALGVFADMLPPALGADALRSLPQHLLETVLMALAGTLGAALVGLVLGLLAARRFAPRLLAVAVRRLLELARTIPEVVWGLVLVAAVGIGPVAGAWALGLHSAGSLGRLFADAFDSAAEAPQRALRTTGASPLAVAAFATLPLAAAPIATHVLFRFEWNLRMATVLGLIGAGGIGQALYEAQQLFFYQAVLAYVLVTAALLLAVDWLSSRARRRLNIAGNRVAARCGLAPAC